MSFIYNNKKESSSQDNPQFLPGMNCANFTGQRFEFERADVSLLTDMSGFFSNCQNLQVTPLMSNLNGKYGLDTMLSGCTDLFILQTDVPINENITLYTRVREPNISASFLGTSILQLSEKGKCLDFTDREKTKILSLYSETLDALEREEFWRDSSGNWQAYPTGIGEPSTFSSILNANGWSLLTFV